ncbi:MAG TPA: glycosyltransferase [Chthoniobacterales bacterium]|jgi:glycosyltransferase involved in cell wall biosynthesis
MKIGFLNRGHVTWTAGSSYTRSMVHAIASALTPGVELCLIGGAGGAMPEIPGVTAIRSEQEQPDVAEISRLVSEHGIDVVLPATEIMPEDIPCGVVGWIPDFQHARLPQYFSESQRSERDHHFRYLVENCDAMLCSSDAVKFDLEQLHPDVETITGTVPFPSSFAYDETPPADPSWVGAKYGLPPVYAIVINQFWRHKNHRVVVEAVVQARAMNPYVFVAMAGTMSDSRDPANAQVSATVQRVFREKLQGHLGLLGEIPGEDLPALLRGASLVIQPSEFEGWNTTVEDALAFGKPVAVSDIPTHREQVPGAFFFGTEDASALAGYLASCDWSTPGWRGSAIELDALAAERARGREWGARAIELCRQAAARHRKNPGRRALWQPSAETLRSPHFQIRALTARVRELEKERAEAGKEVASLRSEVGKLRREIGEMTKKYWQERQKPLRVHAREAIFGRKD